MFRHGSKREQELADRLRREAHESRPAFSESLHARIVKGIERSNVDPSEVPTDDDEAGFGLWARVRRVRVRWAVVAIAAAIVIAVFSRDGNRLDPVRPEQGSRVTASVPAPLGEPFDDWTNAWNLTDLGAEEFGMLVGSDESPEQWAYLDQDLQLAAENLLDQLPFSLLPEDEK